MSGSLLQALWPPARTADALQALARARRFGCVIGPAIDGAGIEMQAAALGIEAESIEACYDDVAMLLARMDSILLSISSATGQGWLLVMKGGRRRLQVLAPDHRSFSIETRTVRDALCAPLEARMSSMLEPLLLAAPPRSRARVRQALLRAHLAKASIPVGWLLRAAPSADLFSQLRRSGVSQRALWLLSAHVIAYVLGILAWALIGAAALGGRYDPGWWLAWVLMIVSLGGLRALSSWWQVQFMVGAATLLKRRLLHGTLRTDHDAARREGAGQLLGRVLESQAIENLGLNGGLSAVVATFEVCACLGLLAYGAGGVLHVVLLLCWLALMTWLVRCYWRCRRTWTRSRVLLTQHLTEQMLGHRTRLVQQAVEQWHDGEDASLLSYNDESKQMDRWAIALSILAPRGWLIMSLAALVPSLLGERSLQSLAIAVGACLLAYNALQKIASGAIQLTTAAIAWEQVAPVFRAGRQGVRPALCTVPSSTDTVLSAQNVVFRYRSQAEPVLRSVDLHIRRGERILLEGSSGSGKSTLAKIISGARLAQSGLLLVNGLDQHTLGDAWRRCSVNVPQFHENHLLSESLAFNLLMGRAWPPAPADLQEAATLCYELGLGGLLERMPGGLWQSIGENGWRLSHGERSRVYLARALLHPASLVLLDESFAALDPENLAGAIDCVLARAPSLIVIAHP